MQEFFNTVKDALKQIPVDVTLDFKIAICGLILVGIAFLIAWAISAGSKLKGLRKKILSATKKLGSVDKIDENNVEIVYDELQKLPAGVTKGWSNFLSQRNDYPSTFISKSEVFGERAYSGKNTAGKVLFAICSAVVWAFMALATSFICQDTDFKSDALLGEVAANILCAVLIPVAFFVILWFVLCAIYGAQQKRAEASFDELMKVLDEKVLIAPIDDEQEDYRTEDLEDVAKQVEELTDGRMNDVDEEVITVPTPTEEIEEAEEAPVEEPEEEPIEMTREEEERYLSILTVVVDDAIADPATGKEDLEEIATLIATAKEEGFREPEDQAILEECLYKLADVYFAM